MAGNRQRLWESRTTRNPLSPSLRDRRSEKGMGKEKKASALLYQPDLREEPAYSQSGLETCLGRAG